MAIVLFFAVYPGSHHLLLPSLLLPPRPGGPEALWVNPAGLGGGRGVSLLGSLWLGGTKLTLVSGEAGPWGLGVMYLDWGGVEFQDETPDDGGGPTFHPYSAEAFLARSFRVDTSTWLSVGAFWSRVQILDSAYSAPGFSLSALHRTPKIPGLWVGLGIRNLDVEKISEQINYTYPTQAFLQLGWEGKALQVGSELRSAFRYQGLLREPGTELSLAIDYWPAPGLGLGATGTYGQALVPVELRACARKSPWEIIYAVRPAAAGFGLVHLLRLRWTP